LNVSTEALYESLLHPGHVSRKIKVPPEEKSFQKKQLPVRKQISSTFYTKHADFAITHKAENLWN
jgi:hypothetical protein